MNKKKKSIAAFVVGLTATLAFGVAPAPAEATYGNTQSCTSPTEYAAIKRTQPIATVHRITEGRGTKVQAWGNWQQRNYSRCGGGTYAVHFVQYPGGTWRVDAKSTVSRLIVERWIDGDTVKVRGWANPIRIIGIDAPETSTNCGPGATAIANRLAPVGSKIVTSMRKGRDTYGRHLASFTTNTGADFGARMIINGQADARYDGQDGYGIHPRQRMYRSLDSRYPDKCNVTSTPSADPWNRPVSSTNPDLDCSDIRRRVRVLPPDYHRLDADGDGWGCESYG